MAYKFPRLSLADRIDISRRRLAYFAKSQAPEIVVKLEQSHYQRLLSRFNQCAAGVNRLAKAVGLA